LPISFDQIGLRSDYSGLDNLHVYGNLLRLYSIVVSGKVGEISRLLDRIRALDDRILTLYVAYVLSRVGFAAQDVVEIDEDSQFIDLDTTTFEDHDWIEHLDSFEHDEEGYRDEWEQHFINEKNETLRIVFINILRSEMDETSKVSDVTAHLLRLLRDNGFSSVYFILHPRLFRKAKKTVIKTKDKMKQILGKDIILSTGELISKFVSEENRRKIIEENWEALRTKILGNFQKHWPIVVLATNESLLSQIRESVRRARLKLEMKHELEDAVKNAGIACEGLLQILHSIYPTKVRDKMTFSDLLGGLREVIIENFGDDIYHDLDLIRKWRNKVLHPPITAPDYQTTLKIVTKAELFSAIFDENLKKEMKPKS